MQSLFIELHDYFARTRDFGLLLEFVNFLEGFERRELLRFLFWTALEERDWELAAKCAAAGFQVVTTDDADSGPLHYVISVIGDRPDIIQWLLRYGAGVERSDACSGFTPLMLASYHGFFETAELLIGEGADVNAHAAIDDYMTPLMIAAQSGDGQLVNLLLSNGADAASVNRWGESAEQLAVSAQHLAIAARIREAASRNEPI